MWDKLLVTAGLSLSNAALKKQRVYERVTVCLVLNY